MNTSPSPVHLHAHYARLRRGRDSCALHQIRVRREAPRRSFGCKDPAAGEPLSESKGLAYRDALIPASFTACGLRRHAGNAVTAPPPADSPAGVTVRRLATLLQASSPCTAPRHRDAPNPRGPGLRRRVPWMPDGRCPGYYLTLTEPEILSFSGGAVSGCQVISLSGRVNYYLTPWES